MLRTALLTFLLVSAIGFGSYLLLKPSKPTEAMESLVLGSTYSELVAIAGEPSYITDGTVWVEPQYKKSDDQLIAGCVKEAWYENIFKLPSKYSFCFSANNKLLHKYHWSSW